MARTKQAQGNGMKLIVLGLGALVVVGGVYWFMRKDSAVEPAGGPAKAGVAVETVRAGKGSLAETLTVAGQVEANAGVELRSEVTGRVVAVKFTDGMAVTQGAPLVVLDDSVQRATLAQAEANYALAEANVGRYQRLVQVGAASQLQVDQAVAEGKLQKANIQMAKAELAKYRIAAPFGGVAGIAQVSVGDLVQPAELLVALTDNAKLKITFKVPEAQATSLKVGAPVKVLGDQTVDGVIDALDGRVDPNSRTLQGKVVLDNADGVLVSGQFVRVQVPVKSVSEAVIVPDSALVPQGTKVFAYVIVPGKDGGQMASRTTVEVGLRGVNTAQIVSGVAEGQEIVTAGQQKLQAPMMPVQLRSPTTVDVMPQAVEELR
jgi:membrane fusion protein (multidrug efflux system)